MAGDSRLGVGLRLALVYGGFFLFIGMFMPYWPAWLKDMGLSPTAIGLLLALTQTLKIITSPLIAQISDRTGKRRFVLSVVAAAGSVTFSLYFGVEGLLALALVTVISHAFIPALLPLTEQFAMSAVRSHAINYGRVRATGSATFIVAALAGGMLVDRYDTAIVLPVCLGALVLTWLATLTLPEPLSASSFGPRGRSGSDGETGASDNRAVRTERRKQRRSRDTDFGFAPIIDLLRRSRFRTMIIIVCLLQASHGVYYALATIHWRTIGLDATVIGLLWSVAVVAEIILFVAAGNRVAALSPIRVFIIVGVLGVVRWSVTAVSGDPVVLGVVQCLHAMTYGATHLATMTFLTHEVPEHRAASAQALYSAGPMGLATGLVLALAGVLYDGVGGGAFWAMAAMCLGAVLAGVGLSRQMTR